MSLWIKSLVPILTAAIAAFVQLRHPKTTIQFKGGAKYPASQASKKGVSDVSIVTDTEKEAFHRDGFILKKSLLQGEELTDLISAGDELYKNAKEDKFSSNFKQLSFDLWRKDKRFAQLAFE